MKTRTFGRLGWQVSEIGFGGWAIGGSWGEQSETDSLAALHRAIELGCNFIDTAQGYGNGRSERLISQALQDHRDRRIYVATKIPPAPGAWPPSCYDRIEERYSDSHIRDRVERSLRDLRTEAIDIVQLHTWTRAWNRNPTALETLRKLQKEGKILGIGISSPEDDQNCLVDLMRSGWLDSVQIIYNIFEQEPQAELLPTAAEHKVGVIARVVFDESALTGKLTNETRFEEGDFRHLYFVADRLQRTVQRVERIRAAIGTAEPDLPTAALKFALKPPAVSTAIPGIRSIRQAELNMSVSDQPPMSDDLEKRLRPHAWRRGFWYAGK